jgi:hypothetical protein
MRFAGPQALLLVLFVSWLLRLGLVVQGGQLLLLSDEQRYSGPWHSSTIRRASSVLAARVISQNERSEVERRGIPCRCRPSWDWPRLGSGW